MTAWISTLWRRLWRRETPRFAELLERAHLDMEGVTFRADGLCRVLEASDRRNRDRNRSHNRPPGRSR